jgi:hypothetical protein
MIDRNRGQVLRLQYLKEEEDHHITTQTKFNYGKFGSHVGLEFEVLNES